MAEEARDRMEGVPVSDNNPAIDCLVGVIIVLAPAKAAGERSGGIRQEEEALLTPNSCLHRVVQEVANGLIITLGHTLKVPIQKSPSCSTRLEENKGSFTYTFRDRTLKITLLLDLSYVVDHEARPALIPFHCTLPRIEGALLRALMPGSEETKGSMCVTVSVLDTPIAGEAVLRPEVAGLPVWRRLLKAPLNFI